MPSTRATLFPSWKRRAFDAVSQQWQLWSSALPGPLQAFTTLEPGQAYWLVAESAAEWRAGAQLGPPPLPPELVLQAESVLATFAQTSPDLGSIETALQDIVGLFAAAVTDGHHPATVLRAIQMALPRTLNAEGDVDAAIEALMAIDQAWNAQATVFGPDGLTVAAAEPFRRELSVYFINGVLNTAAGGAATAVTLSTLLDVPVTHIYNWSFFNGSDYRQTACARAVVDSFADTALVNAICGGIDGVGTVAGRSLEVIAGSIGGVIQTTLQRFFDFDLISSAVNDKLVPMLQADLLAGKAVIVMGHSQGTMFARNALDRVRRWWAEQRDDGLVTGDPAIGVLFMSPAFTTSESDTERYVRLPTDILGLLMVTGSVPTTMLEDSQAWSFPVVGNLFVHMLDTYLEEGTASLREIRSDFAHLRDFLTRDFEGGTTSGVGCTSGGSTWDVNLTQRFSDVRGTISFHACPGGGRDAPDANLLC